MTVRRLPAALIAMLAVPALAQGKKDELEAAIQSALERARPALLAHLDPAERLDDGTLALVCLALLHDGLPVTNPAYVAARHQLGYANLMQTYELSLRLMVMEADATFPEREKIAKKDAARLALNANAGGFHYGPKSPNWDLSNSQYGALGLRAADALGVSVADKLWRKLADEVIDSQQSDGGFSYTKDRQEGSYLSMTVAGIAVLKICEQQLVTGNRTIPQFERCVDKAWKWMEKHQHEVGDPLITWSYYAHYGLERAAILCDVTRLGQIDWYRNGARMLIDQQLGNGGWSGGGGGGLGGALRAGRGGRGEPVSTAFAVLFLRRKFQKTLTAITARIPTLKQLDEQTSERDLLACVDMLQKRGKPALVEVLQTLRSDSLAQRRAAALALRAITAVDFGYDPRLDAEQNRDALRRAELWY